MASGAICVVLFGLGWMAGVFAGVGRLLDAGAARVRRRGDRAGSSRRDGLWRGAIHAPRAAGRSSSSRPAGLGSAADANPFFAASAPPTAAFLAWSRRLDRDRARSGGALPGAARPVGRRAGPRRGVPARDAGYHRPHDRRSAAAPPAQPRRPTTAPTRPASRASSPARRRSARSTASERPPDLPRLPDRRPRRARHVSRRSRTCSGPASGTRTHRLATAPVPDAVLTALRALPTTAKPMDALRTAVSAWGATQDLDWPPTVEQARALTAVSPSALAAFARLREGKDPIEPGPVARPRRGLPLPAQGRAARRRARPGRSTRTSSSAPSTASTPRRSPPASSPRPSRTSRRPSAARSGR